MFKSLLKSLIGLAILVALLTSAWTLYLDPGILETSLDWKQVPQLGKPEADRVGIPKPLIADIESGAGKSTKPGPGWVRTTPVSAPATPEQSPPAEPPPPPLKAEVPAAMPAPVTPTQQPEPAPSPAPIEAQVKATESSVPIPILIAKAPVSTSPPPVVVTEPTAMPAAAAIKKPLIPSTPTPTPMTPVPVTPAPVTVAPAGAETTTAEPALVQPEAMPPAVPARGLSAIGGPQMVPGPALAVANESPSAPDAQPEMTATADVPVASKDSPAIGQDSSASSGAPPAAVAENVTPAEPVEAVPAQNTPDPATQEGVTAQADPLAWSTLMAARRAAWERRPDDAVTLYRQLLEIDPDDFNAYGEMGNVLLHLRRPDEAAEAFKRAADILIARGDFTGANRLLPVIWQLDPEAGRALEAQVSTGANSAELRQ